MRLTQRFATSVARDSLQQFRCSRACTLRFRVVSRRGWCSTDYATPVHSGDTARSTRRPEHRCTRCLKDSRGRGAPGYSRRSARCLRTAEKSAVNRDSPRCSSMCGRRYRPRDSHVLRRRRACSRVNVAHSRRINPRCAQTHRAVRAFAGHGLRRSPRDRVLWSISLCVVQWAVVSNAIRLGHKSGRELLVTHTMWLVDIDAYRCHAFSMVHFVVAEVAFEPRHLTIAFEG